MKLYENDTEKTMEMIWKLYENRYLMEIIYKSNIESF